MRLKTVKTGLTKIIIPRTQKCTSSKHLSEEFRFMMPALARKEYASGFSVHKR
jgi:hypothetical protein